MTVKELAKKVGVQSHVVRYYARIGLLSPRRNPHNQYKIFGADDARRLGVIRQGQQLGFTLAEIRTFLREHPDARSIFGAHMRAELVKHLEDTAEQIQILDVQQRRMIRALARWQEEPEQGTDLSANDELGASPRLARRGTS